MTLRSVFLSFLSALGLLGGILGWSSGWAFAEREVRSPKGSEPALLVYLELGWWNSIARIESGWVPPAEVEDSSRSARVLGGGAAVVLTLGVLCALYVTLSSISDLCGLNLPQRIRTVPSERWKYTGLIGGFSLLFTIGLYVGLLLGAHNEIRRKFGSSVKVWPRPDWASGSAFIGSCLMLGLTYHLMPEEYQDVGYMPI